MTKIPPKHRISSENGKLRVQTTLGELLFATCEVAGPSAAELLARGELAQLIVNRRIRFI